MKQSSKMISGVQEADGKFTIFVSLTKDFRKLKTMMMEEFEKTGQADLIDIKLAPKARA
jgi:hypothetical protein